MKISYDFIQYGVRVQSSYWCHNLLQVRGQVQEWLNIQLLIISSNNNPKVVPILSTKSFIWLRNVVKKVIFSSLLWTIVDNCNCDVFYPWICWEIFGGNKSPYGLYPNGNSYYFWAELLYMKHTFIYQNSWFSSFLPTLCNILYPSVSIKLDNIRN